MNDAKGRWPALHVPEDPQQNLEWRAGAPQRPSSWRDVLEFQDHRTRVSRRPAHGHTSVVVTVSTENAQCAPEIFRVPSGASARVFCLRGVSRGIHSTSRTRVRLVVVVVVVVIVVVVEPRGTFPTRRLGDGPTRRSQDPENSAASSRTGWARVHPAAATTRSTRRNGCSTGCISLSS